ncbi:ENP1 [[Candida] subhashii]|uniref:ENP1 n=1 Tax=[Candida] subhashii TaxID=561895 RepID=A0A8J5V0Z5_9ASCO|nr:ENP1 [[Candida] subhashii]KAG7664039.1 ENP1 [[Candida] subhashii]
MGKISTSELKGKQRHNPLLKDISSQGGNLRTTPRSSSSSKSTTNKLTKQQEEEGYLDATTSRKILQLAKEQQDELEEEEAAGQPQQVSFFDRQQQQKDSDEEEESEEEEYSDFQVEEIYEEEEIEVDEKDAELFNKYFQSNGPQGSGDSQTINLADKIMAKIQEKQDQDHQLQQQQEGLAKPVDAVLLPPKVIMAYEKIGKILSTYTHGKLPKLFKILPSLKNWEDVLYVTNPEQWTPHATYEATKLFVSNLSANQAQKFVENVLLEKFRTSIEDSEDHSLNYHIYRALKKSLYKPAAFFKGFLLPLVDGYCTVREATIAASVLAKVSVPVLHSSVALTQLLQRDFSPATTVFIRVLIEKKYALPYQTLDELVFYFMRFRNAEQMEIDAKEAPQLPVVWHKAFLAFAQRYKNDITNDQRDFLLETVRQRFHHAIGPEIRRELLAGKPRLTDGNGENNNKDGIMIDAF